MTPQKILADGNEVAATQKRVMMAEDQQASFDQILTPEELEASRFINAEFYTASVQVPNSHTFVGKDERGNDITEAYYDHSDPKFQDFDMVRVRVFDSSSGITTEVDHYVSPFHVARWPDRWKAYKAGKQVGPDGASIDQLSGIPPAAKAKMKETGIFTVEQLARLSNANTVISNGAAYQAIARKYLSQVGDSRTAELEDEVETLKAQMAELLKATTKTTK